MRNRWLAVPVLAAAAVIGLAACGSTSSSTSSNPPVAPAASSGSGSSSSSAPATSGAMIKTAHTSLGTILVNSQGFALYMFGPDTATSSQCSGSCATYWPPLKGPVTALPGSNLRPKLLGTIKRADGTIQATYAGHPLYTYKADSSAGMTSGQGLNVSGGFWYVLAPSGKIVKGKASAGAANPQPSTSTSSSGGYGY